MDEIDSGTDLLQSQIEELMHEKSPRARTEMVMAMGNEHRNMLFEVDLTMGKIVKHRWISPGDALNHDEQLSQGNSTSKMEQTFRSHGTITQVLNFATEEVRRTFMQEHRLIRDATIGFTGCYETLPE